MKPVSSGKKALIDVAKAAGYKVTSKQIDRWRLEKLLPEPVPAGRGRAGGIARVAAENTIPQLLALCALLNETRSLDRAAFRLWMNGFDVPLSRVRKALHRMVTMTPPNLAAMSEEGRAALLAEAEMQTAEHRDAPKGVRRYARRGKLAPFLEMVVDATSGSDPNQWPAAQLQDFSHSFEEMSGLDRGRVGAPELDVKPWIRGDTSKLFAESLTLTRDFDRAIVESTSEQFDRARRITRCIEPLRRLVNQGTSQWGHCFGLENIMGAFGSKYPDALLFRVILVLGNAKPDLEDIARNMEADAIKLLDQLQAGLIPQSQASPTS